MRNAPNPALGLAILRVVLGVTFIAHGAPKLFGGGVSGTADFFAQIGIPLAGIAAWGVTLLEFFGGLTLVVGFLVVPVAILLAIEMLVGIVLVHASAGWYVIGAGAQHPPGGVEFNVVLIAGLLALALGGPGLAAVDGRSPASVEAPPGLGEPEDELGGAGAAEPGAAESGAEAEGPSPGG